MSYFNSIVGWLVGSVLITLAVATMIWLTERNHGDNPFRGLRVLGRCWVTTIALVPINHYLLPLFAEFFGPLAYFGMILIHGALIHLMLRQGWLKACWWAIGAWGLLGFGFLLAMLLLGRYGLGVW